LRRSRVEMQSSACVERGWVSAGQPAGGGESALRCAVELFNASTFRHLSAVGLEPGCRVWEAGAGGPSVPSWLAEQVGPEGRVVATDIDTAWMSGTGRFEVRRHDVGVDPPAKGPFDLVHARLLLVHVLKRDRALAGMVSVLRPGGWLVLGGSRPGAAAAGLPGRDRAGPAAGEPVEGRVPRAAQRTGPSTSPTVGRCRAGCGPPGSSRSGPTRTSRSRVLPAPSWSEPVSSRSVTASSLLASLLTRRSSST